jgi:uncharacterized membrane protein
MLTTIVIVLQLVIFFVLPAYLIRLSRRFNANKLVGDIVICYGIGMLIGNTKGFWLYRWTNGGFKEVVESIADISTQTAQISAYTAVLLAIPLLLMINNVTVWMKYTGKIMAVFFLGVLSAMVVCITLGYVYRHNLPDAATTSGMLTGVYIGGTPNMVAVSKALQADDELFAVLNATDTICSGLYFLLLLSIGKVVIRLLLPAFQSRLGQATAADEDENETHPSFPPERANWKTIKPLATSTGIALVAVMVASIPAFLLPDAKGGFNQTVLMLTLTTLGIGMSFNATVRNLQGVYGYAQYLLLIFGLAAGYMSDFVYVLEVGSNYLSFNAIVITCIIGLHLFLSWIIRADTDSFMISSTATIMGPPFVAQMSASLKNKELLPVGIAFSLLGLGLANYAGVLVAWVVEKF